MRPLSLAALLVFSTAVTAQTLRPVRVASEGAVSAAASPRPGAKFPVIVGCSAASSDPVDELGEPLVDVTPTFAVSNRNAIDYIVGN